MTEEPPRSHRYLWFDPGGHDLFSKEKFSFMPRGWVNYWSAGKMLLSNMVQVVANDGDFGVNIDLTQTWYNIKFL